MRLSRRHFVVGTGTAGVGLLAGCGRLPGQGQAEPRARMPRVGYLGPTGPFVQAFEEGLHDYGHVPGQNITVQYPLADRALPASQDDWLAAASELVQSGVDVILVYGGPAAFAAKQATSTIPIVFAQAPDVVRSGLVGSLARPGGNVTGVTNISVDLSAKKVEFLKAIVPSLSCLAVLANPPNPAVTAQVAETQRATEALGLRLLVLEARGPNEFASAFAAASQEHAEAMTILGAVPMTMGAARLADLAANARLPAVYVDRVFPEAGGLMSYGSDLKAQVRRTAYYVDRILKGAKPADLPVEQPMTFELVVNLKTARELGIPFPNEVMLQVTEVMQ
jgi:putative ABC transport system substrate-binding protein